MYRWYIPKDQALKRILMEAEHDSHMAGHFGTYKTIGRIRANFYRPKVDEKITDYVYSCDVCQHNKAMQHKIDGLLEPIDVPMRGRTSIYMDIIVRLPKLEWSMTIWVIVNRFSKMAHFIYLKIEDYIKGLDLTFLKDIWHCHRLPEAFSLTEIPS